MAEYKKPLPEITEDGRPFWEGCKRHELLIQRCRHCHNYQFYPREICVTCMSRDLEWVRATGKGTVYSFSVTYRPPQKEYATPYVVALIDLEEGPRMMSNIIGCKPEDVKIGMRVGVVFEDATDTITLPKFSPLTE